MRRRAAFTLIEMVTVMAIIATLAALTVPRFGRSLELRRAEGAARLVAADVLRAREFSRISGTPHSIAFNTLTSAYTIDMPDPDHPRVNYSVSLPFMFGVVVTSASFNSSPTLSFTSEGLPSAGGTVTVAAGRIARTITINAVSGQPTIGAATQLASAPAIPAGGSVIP